MLLEGGGGKYVVVFDPLDGSSNIDASIPTGMFFSTGGLERGIYFLSMVEPLLFLSLRSLHYLT